MITVVASDKLNQSLLYPPELYHRGMIVACGEAKLLIGVEHVFCAKPPPEGETTLVIFTRTAEGINRLQCMQFYRDTSKWEHEDDARPFVVNPGRRPMNRVGAKEHLRQLGFDPAIIDRLFPRNRTQV